MRMRTKATSVLLLTLFLAGCVPVKKEITENSQQETVATETPSSQVSQVSVVEQAVENHMAKYEELDPALDLPEGYLEKMYEFVNRLGQHYIPFDREEYMRRSEELKPGWEDPFTIAEEIHKEDQSAHLPDLKDYLGNSPLSDEWGTTNASLLKQRVDNGYVLNQDKTRLFQGSLEYFFVLVFEKGDEQVAVVIKRPDGTESDPGGSTLDLDWYYVSWFINEQGVVE